MTSKFISALLLTTALGLTACETAPLATTGSDTSEEKASPVAPSVPPPPPPPPPSVAMSDMEAVTVTSSKISSPPPGIIAPVPVPPRPDKPQPEPQAGMLTAGDYDDTLNPELYKTYLDDMLQGDLAGKDLPFVDAADRIEVHVTDRLGKPVPFASVKLLNESGAEITSATTGAKGKVYFYPAFDDLEGDLHLRASYSGSETIEAKIVEAQNDYPDEVTLSFSTDTSAPQKLDLLFTIDATGSMKDEMTYLQTEFLAIIDKLEESQGKIDIHTGLIVYRDKGDDYVVRDFDFTGDMEAFSTTLGEQSAQGGGDFPEAMHTALETGLGFSWRDDAIKVNMLIADAPPHDRDISGSWASAETSRDKGIHIVPLAASGVDDTAEFLMRSMSQLTMGRYLFLTDDSGIGNAHAEPKIDCYVVTRLDQLVHRVLVDLLTGERVEPEGDQVVRIVGDYKLGRCRIDENDKKSNAQ